MQGRVCLQDLWRKQGFADITPIFLKARATALEKHSFEVVRKAWVGEEPHASQGHRARGHCLILKEQGI